MDDATKKCGDCQGTMQPIIVMDKSNSRMTGQLNLGILEYRMPDDRVSFWTGKYPTAGPVHAFLCEACGRIALFGGDNHS